jgi:hypothetical protein
MPDSTAETTDPTNDETIPESTAETTERQAMEAMISNVESKNQGILASLLQIGSPRFCQSITLQAFAICFYTLANNNGQPNINVQQETIHPSALLPPFALHQPPVFDVGGNPDDPRNTMLCAGHVDVNEAVKIVDVLVGKVSRHDFVVIGFKKKTTVF